jgi:hypothetical protein
MCAVASNREAVILSGLSKSEHSRPSNDIQIPCCSHGPVGRFSRLRGFLFPMRPCHAPKPFKTRELSRVSE